MNPPSRPSPLPRGSTLARLALAGSSFFSATVIGSAQSAPPSAPGDTIVELNPFEVSSDRDHGYQAITTLAGGRIQSDLKDTPATISILTKEFMEDLGLDNNVDFSVWAPNSEIPYTENGFLDEYRTSSRALSPSFGSRNYFRSYTSGDSYNTERLEFARGPNALLFGDASIGGISTVWTKQARLARRIASLQTRVDSYGSYRANIDYNWSPHKAFAVRTNALYAKTESWRDVESATTKAIHLASTFALGPQTQIRVEGEYSDRKLSVPFGVILDQASNYLRLTPEQREAAKWTGTKTTGFPTGTTRYSTDRIVWIESSPDLGALNWINRGLSTGTGLSLVPEGRTALPGFPGLPSREFNANAPSAVLTYETTTASVYLDQKIGNDLFIQVAYNYSLPKNQRDEIRWNDLFIDVNEFLPSPGTPAVNGPRNPYYGVPYADEEARRLDTRNELHEGRVMAAWKFQTSWTDQAFSLLLSQRRDDYLAARSRQVPRGLKTGTAYYSSNSTADILYHRRYWNSLDRGDYNLPPSYVSPSGQTLPIEWRPYEDSRQETTLTSLQLAN
ncbi:MAG TPA: hypothetical protein PLN52_19320, partial [Opitutaceae bacterium]|nr:hypothetical protein [Opitutaceae bacterium]